MEASAIRAGAFGLAVAAGSIAVLAHGLLGLGSVVTGLLLTTPSVVLVMMAPWRQFRPNICDGLAAALLVVVGLSLLLHGFGDAKEVALLGATFGLYVAGRLTPGRDARNGAIAMGVAVLIVAVPVTANALIGQWFERHGKPLVFGAFDAAPAQFAMLLGVVMIAAVASDRLPRVVFAGFNLLAFVSAAVFAASMVRFSLVALELSLLGVALLCEGAVRRRILVLVVILSAAIGAGVAARAGAASVYGHHFLTATGISTIAPDARMLAPVSAGCPAIDLDNSIAIRKQVLVDAWRAIPDAGLFGLGIGGFEKRSCVPGVGPHNSFVEISLEFGWLAGLLLVLLAAAAWRSVASLASLMPDYRFAAGVTIFVVLLSLAYGHISHDFVLFLTLGFAGQLRDARKTVASGWMLHDLTAAPISSPVA